MIEFIMRETPNAEERACYDCRSCKAAISWWCTDPEARAWRGTPEPGVSKCPFWKPARTVAQLRWYERLFPLFCGIVIQLPDKPGR